MNILSLQMSSSAHCLMNTQLGQHSTVYRFSAALCDDIILYLLNLKSGRFMPRIISWLFMGKGHISGLTMTKRVHALDSVMCCYTEAQSLKPLNS